MTINTQWEQITEEFDDEKAIALTEKEDLAISEYKRKREETLNLKLKKGMTLEIEALQSSLKTKEAGMCLIAGPFKFTV